MSTESKQQLVFDEFLVEYYKSLILPLLGMEQTEKLGKALDEFSSSKYDLEKETRATIRFYRELNSFSRSLRILGASESRIEDLFSMLKRLQQILFRLPRYRDHLPHQMRVYLLGCYLLRAQEEFFIENFSAKYAKVIARVVKKEDSGHYDLIFRNLYYGLICNSQVIYDAWSFAGLSHDIGYAVEGISRITDELHSMYRKLQPRLRMKLEARMIPTSLLEDQIRAFEDCLDLLFNSTASNELKKHVSLRRKHKDHGVWGCFFLTSKDLADMIRDSLAIVKQDISNLRIWDLVSGFLPSSRGGTVNNLLPILYADAMIAIAFHNKPYLMKLSPFTALLVISDTLQEWNRFVLKRPFGEEYIPRCVYVELTGDPQHRSVDSEIYVYDCSPTEFYAKMKKDFEANEDKIAPIDLENVKGEFLQGLRLVVKVGPPRNKHTLNV
jgi:hypothetical protein